MRTEGAVSLLVRMLLKFNGIGFQVDGHGWQSLNKMSVLTMFEELDSVIRSAHERTLSWGHNAGYLWHLLDAVMHKIAHHRIAIYKISLFDRVNCVVDHVMRSPKLMAAVRGKETLASRLFGRSSDFMEADARDDELANITSELSESWSEIRRFQEDIAGERAILAFDLQESEKAAVLEINQPTTNAVEIRYW